MRLLSVRAVFLPPLSAVLRAAFSSRTVLLYHARASALEMACGFALGASTAKAMAVGCRLFDALRAVFEPCVIATQVVPRIALAPLLIIWFGFGMKPNIIVVSLVCFFPTFINTFQGLEAYDHDLDLVMRCLRAGRWTRMSKLQLPSAIPYIMAGLKTSALLSVSGCAIAEFIGSDRGLGFLLLQAQARLDTPMIFAAVLALSLLGALAYSVPLILEATVLRRYLPAGDPRKEAPWTL